MAPRRPVIMYRISAVQSLASTRSKGTRRHHHWPRQYLVCPVGSTGCLQSSIMMIMSWSIIMPPSRVQCRLSRGHYSRLVGATSQQGPAHCNCPPPPLHFFFYTDNDGEENWKMITGSESCLVEQKETVPNPSTVYGGWRGYFLLLT